MKIRHDATNEHNRAESEDSCQNVSFSQQGIFLATSLNNTSSSKVNCSGPTSKINSSNKSISPKDKDQLFKAQLD